MLIEKTQQEQTEVQARIESTRKQLSDEVKIAYDAQQWKEAISQYADIQELDAATLNLLVKSVAVHEKIDDDGERHITIEIHFNLQPLPETRECSHYPKRADSEQIFRQTRRISAGILAVFQGNATQYDGKSARIQPLSGSVNTP